MTKTQENLLEEKLEKYKIKILEEKSELTELRKKDKFELADVDKKYFDVVWKTEYSL